MDVGKAALLIATVVGIVKLVRSLVSGSNEDRLTAIVVLGSSIAGVFLVGASVWAHSQVIGEQNLDNLDVASKLLVSLFIAGPATVAWESIKAVRNIGQNEPKPPVARKIGEPKGPVAK